MRGHSPRVAGHRRTQRLDGLPPARALAEQHAELELHVGIAAADSHRATKVCLREVVLAPLDVERARADRMPMSSGAASTARLSSATAPSRSPRCSSSSARTARADACFGSRAIRARTAAAAADVSPAASSSRACSSASGGADASSGDRSSVAVSGNCWSVALASAVGEGRGAPLAPPGYGVQHSTSPAICVGWRDVR